MLHENMLVNVLRFVLVKIFDLMINLNVTRFVCRASVALKTAEIK
jgi:hypothetical protein